MLVHLPEALRTGGLKKTTVVRPIVRNGSETPQRRGARRRRQSTISKSIARSMFLSHMWCHSQDHIRSHVHRSVYNRAKDCAVNN